MVRLPLFAAGVLAIFQQSSIPFAMADLELITMLGDPDVRAEAELIQKFEKTLAQTKNACAEDVKSKCPMESIFSNEARDEWKALRFDQHEQPPPHGPWSHPDGHHGPWSHPHDHHGPWSHPHDHHGPWSHPHDKQGPLSDLHNHHYNHGRGSFDHHGHIRDHGGRSLLGCHYRNRHFPPQGGVSQRHRYAHPSFALPLGFGPLVDWCVHAHEDELTGQCSESIKTAKLEQKELSHMVDQNDQNETLARVNIALGVSMLMLVVDILILLFEWPKTCAAFMCHLFVWMITVMFIGFTLLSPYVWIMAIPTFIIFRYFIFFGPDVEEPPMPDEEEREYQMVDQTNDDGEPHVAAEGIPVTI